MSTRIQNPKSKVQNRRDPYAERRGRGRVLVWMGRLFLLFLACTSLGTAVFLLYGHWREARQGGMIAVEGGDPNLSALERIYLQTYLASQADALKQPVGSGSVPVTFVVAPGESAEQIAANLAAAGLMTDTELFLNYLRYYGLDSQLEAGTFEIDPQAAVPEVASSLTRAFAQEETVRFIEGWRVEEMADYLEENHSPAIANDFLAIAQRRTPFDLSSYEFLASLPADASLEGYLFPDTYRLPADADAAYLVNEMLTNFGRRVTPAMRQAFGANGLSLREAVTLASIVEREAVVAAERPLIASVFLNRLAQGMRLEADPTVQYVVGYQADVDRWWKSPLFQADLALDSSYNTYLYTGLPPGPIANPGLAALEAVANPASTNYIFFVADCKASVPGSHLFSVTYEEHLQYAQACQ
jgi:UPF0755 protein